jgi:hypothetical protein
VVPRGRIAGRERFLLCVLALQSVLCEMRFRNERTHESEGGQSVTHLSLRLSRNPLHLTAELSQLGETELVNVAIVLSLPTNRPADQIIRMSRAVVSSDILSIKSLTGSLRMRLSGRFAGYCPIAGSCCYQQLGVVFQRHLDRV